MNTALKFEELEQAETPLKGDLTDLSIYNKIIVSTSGGKDSAACVLYLLDLGIPKSNIVLWHQFVAAFSAQQISGRLYVRYLRRGFAGSAGGSV